MNRSLSIAVGVLSILAAPVVLAEDKAPPPVEQGEVSVFDYSHSTRSRSEVAAEGREALHSGAFDEGEVSTWEYSGELRPRAQFADAETGEEGAPRSDTSRDAASEMK